MSRKHSRSDLGHHVISSTFSNYLRFGVELLVIWFITPFIIKQLGMEDFGLWSFVFAILGIFQLMDFGFYNATTKYVAQCEALEDPEKRNSIVSTIFFVYLGLAAVALIGISILSLGFTQWFSIPEASQSKARAILWLLAIRTLGIGLPLALFRGVLYGMRRIPLINAIAIVAQVFYATTVWVVLSRGGGVIALATASLAQFALENVLYFVFAFKVTEGLKISWKLKDFGFTKEIVSFSLMMFVATTASMLVMKADPIIIQWALSLTFVSIYAIPLRIAGLCSTLLKNFTNVLSPVITELHVTGHTEKLRSLVLKCVRVALCIGTLIVLTGSLFAHDFLLAWVGEEFVAGAPVLILLLVGMWFGIPQLVYAKTMGISGFHGLVTKVFLAAMVTNIILSIALVGPFGMFGVASATLISAVVMQALFSVATFRYLKISIYEYLDFCLGPLLIPSALHVSVTLLAKSLLPSTHVLMMAVVSLPGVLCYLGYYFSFYVSPRDKKFLYGYLGRARSAD